MLGVLGFKPDSGRGSCCQFALAATTFALELSAENACIGDSRLNALLACPGSLVLYRRACSNA